MEKGYAEGISRIEINSLWGRKHIVWNLRPDVNILSGVNGTGKSTILNKTVARLDFLAGESQDENPEVQIEYFPQGCSKIKYDVIRSIDRPLMHSNLLEKMSDKSVISELDWQLYKLQRRYLDYQVNIGNRTIQLLTSGDPEKLREAPGTLNSLSAILLTAKRSLEPPISKYGAEGISFSKTRSVA